MIYLFGTRATSNPKLWVRPSWDPRLKSIKSDVWGAWRTGITLSWSISKCQILIYLLPIILCLLIFSFFLEFLSTSVVTIKKETPMWNEIHQQQEDRHSTDSGTQHCRTPINTWVRSTTNLRYVTTYLQATIYPCSAMCLSDGSWPWCCVMVSLTGINRNRVGVRVSLLSEPSTMYRQVQTGRCSLGGQLRCSWLHIPTAS